MQLTPTIKNDFVFSPPAIVGVFTNNPRAGQITHSSLPNSQPLKKTNFNNLLCQSKNNYFILLINIHTFANYSRQ
jgi:hypothetical protein